MQVRDTLADHIVRRHECALTAKRGRHYRADALHPREERADGGGGQVRERYHVLAGSHQHVTLEHWPGIEKCHHVFVGEHDVGRNQPGRDVAEQTLDSCPGADGTTFLPNGLRVSTDDSLPEWQQTDDGTFWPSAASRWRLRRVSSFRS